MKKFAVRLLCILLLISLVSCNGNKSDTEETSANGGGDTVVDETAFDVVADGKSDYVIVVNVKDLNLKSLAYSIQQAIFNKTGVMLPVRDSATAYVDGNRILIGDVGDTRSAELYKSVPDNSFYVSVEEGDIVLYARDITGYLLLNRYITETILNTAQTKKWSLVAATYLYDDKEIKSKMTINKSQSASYALVYDATNNDQRILANSVAAYIKQECGLNVIPTPDSKNADNEILFGSVARASFQEIDEYLSKTGDYIAGVIDDKMVISSNDRFGLMVALVSFVDTVAGSEGEEFEWDSSKNISGNADLLPKGKSLERAVSVAKKMYGTYGSWVEKQIKSLSTADAADHNLIQALIARMGDSVALYEGSSSALYDGNIVKCDTEDYSKVTYVKDSHVYMAAQFAEKYFGKTLAKENGYVDVTAICNASADHNLYYNASYKIAIIVPTGVASYSTLSQKIGDYTNREYILRMTAFFNNVRLPEPNNNVEQTRVEIMAAPFESKYIYDYTLVTYDNYYSPAICIPGDDSVIYVAHEISKLLNHKEISTVTYLKKSTDGGVTWKDVNSVVSMRWASVFELDGKIYLLGTHSVSGAVHIAMYDPSNDSFKANELEVFAAGSAPNTVSIHNGRLFRAHNQGVVSVDVSTDLFDSDNWTVSNDPNLFFTRAIYEETTGLQTNHKKNFMLEEGNIVIGKDGTIYAVYRIDASDTWGHAAIFTMSEDGKTISFIESCNSIIDFPSNQSKFVIRYDEKTDKYITFTSYPTMDYPHQRNVLCMAVSDDLFNWEVVDILLVERAMMNNMLSVYAHAFQYVDFDFCGDDIYFIVREATGDTCMYHDGTYVTMYTVSNYVDFINSRLP